jgi:drug/metabolite transporter (DMT)-like permease
MTGKSAAGAGNRVVPRRALVLLVILTLVWGTNWPLFPFAMREISVWTFRAISMVGAGCVLLLSARLMGLPLAVERRHWPTLVAAACLYLLVWNVASSYAAIQLPSGQAAVVGFTMPLWAALIAWLFLGERPTLRVAVAITLGALAVLLLMVPSFADYADAPRGLAWGLAAAMGWAAGTLVLKRGRIDVPAPVLTGWQMLVAAVPVVVGAFVAGDRHWFMPSPTTIAVVAYITLVPMTIGNICWFAIVGLLPANIAGLSSIMVPIVAMISGAIVLGEPLGPLQWLAMLLSTTAITLALRARRPAA